MIKKTYLLAAVLLLGFFGFKANAASITVVSPNGGEQWIRANSYEIKWESSGITSVGITLYDGSSTYVIKNNIPASDKRIIWTPGTSIPAGSNYKIGIYQYPWSSGLPVDYSNNTFSLTDSQVVTPGTGTNYYVDSASGSDSNSGTSESSPWKSLSPVQNRTLQAGETVNLKRGSKWSGGLVVDNSGTEGNPITFQAYGSGNAPIIENPGNSDNWTSAIEVKSIWIVIKDLLVQNSYYFGVNFGSSSQHVTVENCEATNTGIAYGMQGQYGLVTKSKAHDLTMVVNDVPSGQSGYTGCGTNASATNGDNDFGADCVQIYNSNNEVSYNVFQRCIARSYDYCNDGAGIEFYGTANNNKIHHNWVSDSENFMEVGGGSSSTNSNNSVFYNVSVNNKGLGYIHIKGGSTSYGVTVSNLKFENNTFVETLSEGNWAFVGFSDNPSSSAVSFRNNIFYLTNFDQFSDRSSFGHTYNLYYMPGGSLNYSAGTGEISGQDPRFTDLNQRNLRLQSSSPAMNKGTSLGFATTDMDGSTVPYGASPDMGAYEYGSSPSSPTPTPTQSASPTPTPNPTPTPTQSASPTPTPNQTLSVSLSANPTSGTAPVDVTADVAGSATGTINYTFYCNRSDSGTNVNSSWQYKLDGTSTDPLTVTDVCSYRAKGTYNIKVVVERGSQSAEKRLTINVTSDPTEFIIDNRDALSGFSASYGQDAWTEYLWEHNQMFLGSHVYNRNAGTGSDKATWSFTVPKAGVWQVYVWWFQASFRPTNVPLTIEHYNGSSSFTMNQTQNGGKWNLIAEKSFNTTGKVVMSDNYSSGKDIVADAVRLVYKGPISSATPTPTPIFTKSVIHEATFFPNTKQYLRTGDIMRAGVIRNSPDTPMTSTDSKWISRIATLNAVNVSGIKKELIFSAIDDVRNLISLVPSNIEFISYNLEEGMSPASEFVDVPASVKSFADIVHGSGKKMNFIPTISTWNNLTNSQLTAVLNAADGAMIQEQKWVEYYGNDIGVFVSDIQAKGEKFKGIDPDIKLYAQLWLGIQTSSQIVDGFIRTQNYFDASAIGTFTDEAGVIETLKGLGRTAMPTTPTPTPSPSPTPTPNQTLSTSLSANPTSGVTPIDLTTTVSGTANGTINYTFYCNRSDSGTNVTTDWSYKLDGSSNANLTTVDTCSYSAKGTYTIKVIAERGSQATEKRLTINVTSDPTEFIIDNRDSGFSTSYTQDQWVTYTWEHAQMFRGDHVYNRLSGTGSDKATWSFTVPKAGKWEVSLWWFQASFRPTNVPLTIEYYNGSSGNTTSSFTVNETQNGGKWNVVTEKEFNTTGKVVMSDKYSTGKDIVADAVRLVYKGPLSMTTPTPTPTVSPTPTPNQTLSVSLSANPTSGTAPVDVTADVAGSATGTINYTFYCNRSDSGTNVNSSWQYKLDGTSTDPLTVTDVCSYRAKGTYNIKVVVERGSQSAEKRLTINVTSDPTEFIIDNRDALSGFSASYGQDAWTEYLWEHNQMFLGSHVYNRNAGTGSDKATWSFTVPKAGVWQVYVWWFQASFRPTNVPLTIEHYNGSSSFTMNQTQNGGKWNLIAEKSFNTTGKVVMSDNYSSGKDIVADAVRLVYKGPLPGTPNPTPTPTQSASPTPTPNQTLSVSLSASSTSGNVPLNGLDLTADVAGSATGTINYTFYCNRSDSGTNVTSGYAKKVDGITTDPYTATDVCSYSAAGTYTAKVIAERGTLVVEKRTTVTVSTTPTPTPTPTPSPTPSPTATPTPTPNPTGSLYYISTSGNDSNAGTLTSPLRTVQKCLDKVKAGDACLIRGGTYNEALVLKTSGDSANRILISNCNNEEVTLNSGSSMNVRTNGRKHYYTFSGLRFVSSGSGSSSSAGQLDFSDGVWDGEDSTTGGNNGFVISNCYIEGGVMFYGHNILVENSVVNGKDKWYNGIMDRFANSHSNVYRYNTVYSFKERGIWSMTKSYDITIEHNTVYNIGDMGIDCDGAGSPIQNCRVLYNTVYSVTSEGTGIELENCFNCLAEGNYVHDVVGEGIEAINYGGGPDYTTEGSVEYRDDNTNTVIRNNLIVNSNTAGIICRAAPGLKIYSNTIYGNKGSKGYFAGIALTEYGGYYCHNAEIKNNIVAESYPQAIWLHGPSSTASQGLNNLVMNNNLYYQTQKSATHYGNSGGLSYTLSQFASATGQDTKSLSADPQFSSVSGKDFHLKATSPAIDAGIDVGIIKDLDGNQRPIGGGYDIGTYEFK